MSQQDITKYIEAALLRPDATEEQVRAFCNEARERGWLAVCVNPAWVELARNVIANSRLILSSVASFPFGAGVASAKNTEARLALEAGAIEINMVLNTGALKGGEHGQVEREIAYVLRSVKNINSRAALKVIIECPLLTSQEKQTAAKIAANSRADFIVSGTGFSGATTVEDVQLLRSAAGNVPVCAEGARTLQEATAFLQAGAARIITPHAAAIVAA